MPHDDNAAPKPRATTEGMGGLAKGLRIIEAFGTERNSLTIAAAARAADTSRASARRCMLTLLDLGYVMQSGSVFRPTPRLMRLGAAYFERATLPQLAQSHLESARDSLTESVSLAVLDGDDAVFVARAEAEKIVSTAIRIGARLPGYASATGRVLLASLPEAALDDLLARIEPRQMTPLTVTDKGALKTLLSRVRDTGVAVTEQELEVGMVAMAVPVSDTQGNCVAAMSVSASSARISGEMMINTWLPILRQHSEALSRTLG